MTKKTKWLLDAGHGGACFGHYLTPGKRSPGKRSSYDPGIYEGEFNRKIALGIANTPNSQECKIINPGPMRISTYTKRQFVNQIAAREKVALLLIHANASPPPGWSDARGFVVMHSPIASRNSIRLAELIEKQMRLELDGYIQSRGIKKKNLSLLSRTSCPAVLTECGFMTNRIEAALLEQYHIQQRIINAHSDAMTEYNGG